MTKQQQLLQEIAKISRMERGSIAYTPRLSDNGEKGFYNHTVYEDGKSKTRYVRKDEVKELRRLISEHRKFKMLIAEYEQFIIEQTRAERASRRSGG